MSAFAALDLVCCAVVRGRLAVLARDPARGARTALPWERLGDGEGLESAAAQVARATLGHSSPWMAQVGAFGDATKHPSGAALTIGYVAVVPAGTEAPDGHSWHPLPATGVFGGRQQRLVTAAIAALRDRMDLEPIAFRMLPPSFTLSELQELYELLLGRRLHRASFRRTLQGSYLVEPLDEWRSEGRGRPAQLFRYTPRRHRGSRRPVRFELLG